MRIQKPVNQMVLSILRESLTTEIIFAKAPSLMFDWVLNALLLVVVYSQAVSFAKGDLF